MDDEGRAAVQTRLAPVGRLKLTSAQGGVHVRLLPLNRSGDGCCSVLRQQSPHNIIDTILQFQEPWSLMVAIVSSSSCRNILNSRIAEVTSPSPHSLTACTPHSSLLTPDLYRGTNKKHCGQWATTQKHRVSGPDSPRTHTGSRDHEAGHGPEWSIERSRGETQEESRLTISPRELVGDQVTGLRRTSNVILRFEYNVTGEQHRPRAPGPVRTSRNRSQPVRTGRDPPGAGP
ncbi:hypothetical protein KGM_213198 [Danaus plexippus plexippus]|uniref:Uncharacterized protein n=1 Tax=Danaus plexippus plexippus TaxID=278856 RepID=A0A212FAX5_DANPL|nr:hypothetical protein KGM_213198 [Danaus plexippus plexippus]